MKVFVSTADASGDLHAAALLKALRRRLQHWGEGLEAFGLGGDALEAAGFESIVPQRDVAVAGLVEVLGHAPWILSAYVRLRRELVRRKPDLAILVDSPDLNMRFAAVAKRAGIPVFYYVAPQVWAWRSGRVHALRKRADAVGVIFPFEEALLRSANVPATFVGHPLVDRMGELSSRMNRAVVAIDLALDTDRPIIGLLPGSRRNELAGNLSTMLETAELVHRALPDAQICLLLAPTLVREQIDTPEWMRVIRGRTHEAMAISTVLLAAPGTVTVEAALLGTPLVVMHRGSTLSFEVARRISRVPSSCMVNLIADRGVVSERLQWLARPTALAAELCRLVREPAARETLRKELGEAANRLGEPGASDRAAELALHAASAPLENA